MAVVGGGGGRPLLLRAAYLGHTGCIRELVRAKADVNAIVHDDATGGVARAAAAAGGAMNPGSRLCTALCCAAAGAGNTRCVCC